MICGHKSEEYFQMIKSLICFLDENAVSFAQAEKLYYETSLISVGSMLQPGQDAPSEYRMPAPSCRNDSRL